MAEKANIMPFEDEVHLTDYQNQMQFLQHMYPYANMTGLYMAVTIKSENFGTSPFEHVR